MSEEIRVVYADILKASNVFKSSGKEYADIVPSDIGAIPQVTEGSLGQAISSVLEAIEVMHDALGSSMQTHGDKLQHVDDTIGTPRTTLTTSWAELMIRRVFSLGSESDAKSLTDYLLKLRYWWPRKRLDQFRQVCSRWEVSSVWVWIFVACSAMSLTHMCHRVNRSSGKSRARSRSWSAMLAGKERMPIISRMPGTPMLVMPEAFDVHRRFG